jgi:glycerol-3-phosphate dehydrogenase
LVGVKRLAELGEHSYDLLVVGGGIIGAGVARDAARRGLRTVLVESADFGAGTSSRPTRLVHGGLRYLEFFDFPLVRIDMREREVLLRTASHLVFPLPFLLPMYGRGPLYRVKLRAGMQLYDALSYDKSLPGRRWLSPAQALDLEPGLRREGLQGAWRFYDAQVPLVERLVLENVADAAAHGAAVRNHARVGRFLQEEARIVGGEVEDQLSGDRVPVRAALTVNATGPWLDQTAAPLRPHGRPLLRLTKGVHLVTPPATRHAQVLFAPADRRLFFVIPWLDRSLVGTTDTDFAGDPAAVAADWEDVRYLVEAVRQAFPGAGLDHIHYAMAGVRALPRQEGLTAGAVSRRHVLVDHAKPDRIAGLLSVAGGKLTAYRSIAEEVVDWACARLQRRLACDTARQPLPGALHETPERFVEREVWPRARALGLARAQAEHLVGVFGAGVDAVLRRAEKEPALTARLHPQAPDILAQLVHAVDQEWAMTLSDFLLRRTSLGLAGDQARQQAPAIARQMGRLLGWDRTVEEQQLADYAQALAPMRRFSGPATAQASDTTA